MNVMTRRRQRHSPEQIVRKIQDADRMLAEGGDVAAVLKELNVTESTYFRWWNHEGDLNAEAEIKKAVLKELAEGNF